MRLLKKKRGKAGKQGLWKKKLKVLVSKQVLFKHIGQKYLKHKAKLQMGKQWLFYTYVSRIRANLNNMALMRLKLSFQNFKTYSEPMRSPPIVPGQGPVPIESEND